jgi:hypothetical protein
MRVGPAKLELKPPGSKRLNLKCGVLLSSFAFKFNLRRYIMGDDGIDTIADAARTTAGTATRRRLLGRGLHPSTSQLNLSRF